jgi:hypothetical protein
MKRRCCEGHYVLTEAAGVLSPLIVELRKPFPESAKLETKI